MLIELLCSFPLGQNCWLDLRPYMDTAPYAINASSSVQRCYRCVWCSDWFVCVLGGICWYVLKWVSIVNSATKRCCHILDSFHQVTKYFLVVVQCENKLTLTHTSLFIQILPHDGSAPPDRAGRRPPRDRHHHAPGHHRAPPGAPLVPRGG